MRKFSLSSNTENPFFVDRFKWKSYVESFVFGDAVQEIPPYICCGMRNLQTIEVHGSPTSIGKYAFSDCYSLAAIDIPESVTTIENGAFANCFALTSVVIPSSVTYLGGSVFSRCESLTSLTVHALRLPIIDGVEYAFGEVFWKVDKQKCTLYVPEESLEWYKANYPWKDFFNILNSATICD